MIPAYTLNEIKNHGVSQKICWYYLKLRPSNSYGYHLHYFNSCKDIQIDNEIGKMFLVHNILEYKAPKAELNIDTLYKATAYASLYKSYGEKVDVISADDITVSLVREAKPHGLFRYFKKHGYSVSNPYHGIYLRASILICQQITAICFFFSK